MANSMTAFSRETSSAEWGTITCELRSVNHRYLEINPRLSDELRQLEPRIRDAVSARVKRGRVDCYIKLQSHETTRDDFVVDRELLARVAKMGGDTLKQYPHLAPLPVSEVLGWPGVVQVRGVDSEALAESAMELVNRALDRIETDRAREGARLKTTIEARLRESAALVENLKARVPELTQAFRDRIMEKLQDASEKLDPDRVEQELVIYVQKSDATEEIDRLQIHLDEVREVLAADGAIGRRLDFLMQELNREANTLGAKSFDMALTQTAVDLKVLIEQMREQIQNIE
ncbi:MAG: YicC/YloC family endoribonuclease [Gammaproteobacteria bacterium]|nr:YicC/YloC family endoribonuclease [Gammaproteobacteria bacterium]